jgi:hypothetical protein
MQSWLGTESGCAWLWTKDTEDWLRIKLGHQGRDWLAADRVWSSLVAMCARASLAADTHWQRGTRAALKEEGDAGCRPAMGESCCTLLMLVNLLGTRMEYCTLLLMLRISQCLPHYCKHGSLSSHVFLQRSEFIIYILPDITRGILKTIHTYTRCAPGYMGLRRLLVISYSSQPNEIIITGFQARSSPMPSSIARTRIYPTALEPDHGQRPD